MIGCILVKVPWTSRLDIVISILVNLTAGRLVNVECHRDIGRMLVICITVSRLCCAGCGCGRAQFIPVFLNGAHRSTASTKKVEALKRHGAALYFGECT
jgi:hypothetical protein